MKQMRRQQVTTSTLLHIKTKKSNKTDNGKLLFLKIFNSIKEDILPNSCNVPEVDNIINELGKRLQNDGIQLPPDPRDLEPKISTLPDGFQQISFRKINFSTSHLLGKGSFGGIEIYEGKFGDRKVAVKRIKKEFSALAENEMKLLTQLDCRPQILRFIDIESCKDYYYIALELCLGNLFEFVNGNEKFKEFEVSLQNQRTHYLRKITKGLKFIHKTGIIQKTGIIHQNIKPENILMCKVGNKLEPKISDFKMARELDLEKPFGVNGNDERLSYNFDIYSLGLLYYFVLSNGRQLCSENGIEQQFEIQSDARNKGAAELILRMIHSDPRKCPPLKAVLKCPMFWDHKTISEFFGHVKDFLHKKSADDCPILKRFEDGKSFVFKGKWTDSLESRLSSILLTGDHKCTPTSIRNLLKAIRDKEPTNHFTDLPEDVRKEVFGQKNLTKKTYLEYWLDKFPNLLQYTWEVFEELKNASQDNNNNDSKNTDEIFRNFYCSSYDFSKHAEMPG